MRAYILFGLALALHAQPLPGPVVVSEAFGLHVIEIQAAEPTMLGVEAIRIFKLAERPQFQISVVLAQPDSFLKRVILPEMDRLALEFKTFQDLQLRVTPENQRESLRRKFEKEEATFALSNGRRGYIGGLPGARSGVDVMSASFQSWDFRHDVMVMVQFGFVKKDPPDPFWDSVVEGKNPLISRAAVIIDAAMKQAARQPK